MDNQIQQLLNEVAAAGAVLPILLMFMPRALSENVKKGITFIACLILTVVMTIIRKDGYEVNLTDVASLVPHLILILTVAHQTYDKVWKPAADTLARKTPLKFLRRSKTDTTVL